MMLRPPRSVGVVGALAVVVAGATLPLAGLRLQWTDSLPKGLYRDVLVGRVQRGTLGIWCLPAETGRWARARGYLGRGPCPGEVESIGKIVLATGGDTVAFGANGVRVNGLLIEGTRPLTHDSRGRPLPHATVGVRVLDEREVWLWSPYSSRSFDSRYFGPVFVSALVTRVRPLLTCCADRRGQRGAEASSE